MTIEQRQTLIPIASTTLLFSVRTDSPRHSAELGAFTRPVLAFRSGRETGAPFGKEDTMTTYPPTRPDAIRTAMRRHREILASVQRQAAGIDPEPPQKNWGPLVGVLIALTVAGLTVWAAFALVLA